MPPQNPNQSNKPGTASRLTTGMNRPGTRGASIPNQTIILNPAKADDRPMTRGGLGGIQDSSGGFNRKVQDKTYFSGLLRTKVTEINNEVNRINKDINVINSDSTNYQAYNKKAEELAQQIEDSLADLSDYNTLLDRLNISSNVQDLKKDYMTLKGQNDEQAYTLDELFMEKAKKDETIKKLEKHIDEEKQQRENYLASLSGSMRTKYQKIKSESTKLQEETEQSQNQIEKLKEKFDILKDQIKLSSAKQEAAHLLDQLHDLEMKRSHLEDENKNKLSPAEEREYLLKQAKENNQEIATIEKQISELKENIESVKRDLAEQVDDDPSKFNDEDSQKYKELKKREIQMDEFLENFEENKKQEVDQLNSIRKTIVSSLEVSSKALAIGKKDMVSDSKSYKISDLRKAEGMEEKLLEEIKILEEKRSKMKKELVIYQDLEKLKRKTEVRKEQLKVEKQNLSRYKENIKHEIEALHMQVQTIEAQLNDNETHSQLSNLEKRMQLLEQNNFTMKDAINSVSANSDYENIKVQVLALVAEHNKWIQEELTKY